MDRRAFALAALSLLGRRGAVGFGRLGARGRPGPVVPRRFAELPQGRIAYLDRGQGPGALLLHGFPLSASQWRDVIPRLAAGRRCIAPDFLGLGYSEPSPGQDLTPRSQAETVVALLDRLGVGPVDVVANDSGVAVAQLLLRDHPGRVRTLLLTNGDTEPDCPPPALRPVIELAKRGRYAAEWLAPWAADKDLARSATGLGGMTFTRPEELTDAILDDYLAPLVARPALTNRFAAALEANALEGMSAVLAASRVPIRLIWGTGDPIFSAGTPDYYARTAGGWRGVRRIEGAKLFFPEEFPDVIAEEARALQAT